MKDITIHDQKYIAPTWSEMGGLVFELSQKIIASGEQYDRVVALAKGGLTFSRTLVDYLGMKGLSSIQIEFYSGIGTGVTGKTPVITQSLPVSVRDERILIFDDVLDTGESMKIAVSYLKYHGCKKVSTATIMYKPWATTTVDFYAHETKAWILFPHEQRESIKLLSKMWAEKGDTPIQIHEQLLKVGLPKAEVEFFSKLQ